MLRECGAAGRELGKVPASLESHGSAGTSSLQSSGHSRLLGETSGRVVQIREVRHLGKLEPSVREEQRALSA